MNFWVIDYSVNALWHNLNDISSKFTTKLNSNGSYRTQTEITWIES